MAKKSDDQFSKKEAAQRFEAALKGARLAKNESQQASKPAKKRRK